MNRNFIIVNIFHQINTMETTTLLLLLFGIALPPLSTAAEYYQPIKITVNEHFNAQMSHISQELPSLGTNFVHQGANFFFNPQVQLPLGLMPPHVEALLTSIHQKNETIIVENPPKIVVEEEITEVLAPIKPIPEIKEEVIETIKITEIPVPKPVELIAELPPPKPLEVLAELPVPKPIEIIVEEKFEVPLPINDASEHVIQELVPIPEAPVLPPLSLNFKPPLIKEEVEIEIPTGVLPCVAEVTEKPIIVEEEIEVISPIPDPPMLQAIEVPDMQGALIMEDILQPAPCTAEIVTVEEKIEPIVIPKPQQLVVGLPDPLPIITQMPIFAPMFNEERKYAIPKINQHVPILLPKNIRPSLVPVPRLNVILKPKLEEKNEFMHSTSCAHRIVAERVAPNIRMKGQAPKLFKIISSPSKSSWVPVK